MNSASPSLSVVLLTKNSQDTVERALRSVVWADEIVVVDDESTDGTLDICRRYTDRIFIRKLESFAAQRNFGREQARGEWLLSLDPDEEVSPELREEIERVIHSATPYVAFYVPFRQRIFGKWIRYGGWTMWDAKRLFRRDAGVWVNKVHEVVRVEGPVGRLQHPILHYSHESIGEFIAKLNWYTDWEAEERFRAGDRPGWLRLLLVPVRDFWRRYIVQQGFRDGVHGLVLALLMAFYVFTVRAKVWERAWGEEHGL